MASCPITSLQIERVKVEAVTDFIFLGSKITVDSDYSQEIKRCLLLGRKDMTNLDSIFGEGNGTTLQYSSLGKSHGWRSLKGCSPWGRWGSNTTERLHFHFSLSCTGEGNGNPLQCSCLENPREGEPGGLSSMGSHRVRHNWSDLAAANSLTQKWGFIKLIHCIFKNSFFKVWLTYKSLYILNECKSINLGICIYLRRKAMTNLNSILRSRDITLPTKVCLAKAMVFPVVMYGRESWTVKKAEHQRIDAFELWHWSRLLRVPWTARRSNQSILMEITCEY